MANDNTIHPLVNYILAATTALMGWLSDMLPTLMIGVDMLPLIDFLLGILTKIISVASFFVLLVINYETIVKNIKKIFRIS